MLAGSITFQFGKNKNLKTKKLAAKYIAIFLGLPVRKKKQRHPRIYFILLYLYYIYAGQPRAP